VFWSRNCGDFPFTQGRSFPLTGVSLSVQIHRCNCTSVPQYLCKTVSSGNCHRSLIITRSCEFWQLSSVPHYRKKLRVLVTIIGHSISQEVASSGNCHRPLNITRSCEFWQLSSVPQYHKGLRVLATVIGPSISQEVASSGNYHRSLIITRSCEFWQLSSVPQYHKWLRVLATVISPSISQEVVNCLFQCDIGEFIGTEWRKTQHIHRHRPGHGREPKRAP
jgi:hypothetical protein